MKIYVHGPVLDIRNPLMFPPFFVPKPKTEGFLDWLSGRTASQAPTLNGTPLVSAMPPKTKIPWVSIESSIAKATAKDQETVWFLRRFVNELFTREGLGFITAPVVPTVFLNSIVFHSGAFGRIFGHMPWLVKYLQYEPEVIARMIRELGFLPEKTVFHNDRSGIDVEIVDVIDDRLEIDLWLKSR